MLADVSQSTRSKRPTVGPAVYSLRDLAGLLAVSYTTAHEMALAGTLPITPIRIGRKYLFAKADVHRLLGIEPDQAA